MTIASEQVNWNAQLRSLLSRVKESESAALFCHQNADPDATCSAFALQSLIRKLAPATSTKIVCPEGVSSSTKQLLENLGITVPDGRLPAKVDLAILVDTNTLDQLGQTAETLTRAETPIIVVDHHHPHPDTVKIASQLVVDESAAAAAEVVYKLWQTSNVEVGAQEARSLLAAIFIETKHFLLATESTFEIAAGLVKAGADPRHLSELMSNPVSRSERIARLKAAGRSQVAVAFVAGESKEKIRVNMRATEGFYSKTGIHLARDVSIPIGKKLSGVGGGHATAAGLSVPGQLPDVLKICVDVLKESLGPLQT